MMNKAKFLLVLDRQRKSGLSVSEFCGNEGYPVSTFYYWKRKFAPTPAPESTPEPISEAECSLPEPVSGLAPVRFCAPKIIPSMPEAPKEPDNTPDQIRVGLPGGVTIHFSGPDHSRTALDFISQIYRSHVLPE